MLFLRWMGRKTQRSVIILTTTIRSAPVSNKLYLSESDGHPGENDQLFFMHIPKTAGTTLVQIIEQQFEESRIARWLYPFRLVDELPGFFKEHQYFHGHVEYALMCSLLPRRPMTITILRDPVEQYLSQFGNNKRVSLSQIPDWTPEIYEQFQRTPLSSFVCDPPEILIPVSLNWQNRQAKMLALEFQGDAHGSVAEADLYRRTPMFILPTPTIEAAKVRLNELTFFGITERFQDSLFLMAYTFGWLPTVDYENMNTGLAQRPRRDDLPTDLLKQIQDLNRIDSELYDYAQHLFEARYEQMCHELVEQYGRREHAPSKLPLSRDLLIELLDLHYQRRFVERNPAIPALRFKFDRKLSGRNWQVRELGPNNQAFRWSGPGRCSTMDFPIAATSDVWLRLSIFMAITEEVMASLVTKVNDQTIEMTVRRADTGARILEGCVSQEVLRRRPGCARVSLEVERTLRPSEIIPASKDNRLLGIALNCVEFEPIRTD